MLISLKGKTALVPASTRGLGKAIAVQLAASGAQVTLLARDENKLGQALADLPSPHGQKHGYLEADFNEYGRFTEIVTEYFSDNYADILILNTQGPPTGTVLEKEAGDYQSAFDLLFKPAVFLASAALPAMKQNGFGRIINVASVSVRQPIPHLALSNVIRPALAAWVKGLSAEVAKDGITVNTILTGLFDTERIREVYATQAQREGIPLEELKTRMAAGIPAGRLGKPEEYGYLAAFLASEQAAYLTGAMIPLDGGMMKGTF